MQKYNKYKYKKYIVTYLLNKEKLCSFTVFKLLQNHL